MMSSRYLLTVLCVAVAAAAVTGYDFEELDFENSTCGGNLTDPSGSFNVTATKNSSCIWIIDAGANFTGTTMVYFSSLNIAGGTENLTVYSLNNNSSQFIVSFSSQKDPVAVLSNTRLTKVVLNRGLTNKTTTDFVANYNTKKCGWTVSDTSLNGKFSSPYYLPNTTAVECNVTLQMESTTSDLLVVTFNDFNLTKDSLELNTSKTHMNFTDNPDDVFLTAEKELRFRLNLQKSNVTRHFTVSYFTANPACSGIRNVQDTGLTRFSLPNLPYPVVCHAVLTAKAGQVVKAESMFAGPDVVFSDGGSARAKVIGHLTSGQQSSLTSEAFFVSSRNQMLIQSIRRENSLPSMINVQTQKSGGFFPLKVNESQLIKLNGKDVGKQSTVFQLQADIAVKVHIDVSKSSFGGTGQVEVYEGFHVDIPLVTFKKGSAFFPVTSRQNQLTVIAKGFTDKDTLQANISTYADDCNAVNVDNSGWFTWITQPFNTKCTWVIRPVGDKPITMVQLQNLNLCAGSNLTVYQGLNTSSPVLATYTGGQLYPSLPTIQVPSSDGLRFSLNNNVNCSSSDQKVMSARYWSQGKGTVCGQTGFSGLGAVSSPNFPNQYPLNSHCSWPVPVTSKNNTMAYFTFTSLDLNPKHQVALMQKTGNKTKQMVNVTGSSLPAVDWLYPNKNLSLDFSSVALGIGQAGQGFMINYKVLTCGGLKTSLSGNFSISLKANQSADCIWIFQLKQKAYNTSVNITFSATSLGQGLELREGGTQRSPVITVDWKKNNTVISRTSLLWVRFSYQPNKTALTNSDAGFNFTFKYSNFSCNRDHQCITSGECIHPDWLCNGVDDCGDNTDERNCVAPIPTPKTITKTKGVAAYWIVLCLIFGLILGVVLAFLIPAIYRRIKYPNYGQLREFIEPSEA